MDVGHRTRRQERPGGIAPSALVRVSSRPSPCPTDALRLGMFLTVFVPGTRSPRQGTRSRWTTSSTSISGSRVSSPPPSAVRERRLTRPVLDHTERVRFYYNAYSGELSLAFPKANHVLTGGILADVMGMGKTLYVSMRCSSRWTGPSFVSLTPGLISSIWSVAAWWPL